MKKSFQLVFFVLTLTALACGFNFSTANISDAKLAKDEAGDQTTTTFAQDDSFYAIVELANAPDDTTVKAEWTAVEADGVDPNFVIGEKDLAGGGTLTFSLNNDQLWPVGQYKVDLYLNDKLERTLEFTVEGDVVAEQAEPEAEPTATPVPEPTAEPTEDPTSEANQAGDSLAGNDPPPDTAELTEGVIFQDTFDNYQAGWDTGNAEDEFSVNEAVIEDGKYTVTVEAKQTAYVEKFLTTQDFSDFILMLEATPTTDEEFYSYGVSFRINEDGHGYTFEIGNDGLYSISVYDGEWQTLVEWTKAKAIKIGQTNKIAVVAQGEELQFYVNDDLLTSLKNDTTSTGQVAVVVDIFEEGKSAAVEFDNLLVGDPTILVMEDLGGTSTSPTADEPLVFQNKPYEHPSGAFSFAVPESWEPFDEFDTGVNISSNGDNQALIGSVFVDAGFVHTRASFQTFIDDFIASFVDGFGESYDVVEQTGDPNDKVFVTTTYQAKEGDGNIQFMFMQRKTVVFVLVFITPANDDLKPAWEEILASYTVDPDAALKAAPAPAPPTATPKPAPAGPSAPAGKGLFIFRNQTGGDFIIDVIGPTNDSQVIPPNSSHNFTLDPGSYIINGHSPGGQYVIDAYSFDIAAGQVFPLNLN